MPLHFFLHWNLRSSHCAGCRNVWQTALVRHLPRSRMWIFNVKLICIIYRGFKHLKFSKYKMRSSFHGNVGSCALLTRHSYHFFLLHSQLLFMCVFRQLPSPLKSKKSVFSCFLRFIFSPYASFLPPPSFPLSCPSRWKGCCLEEGLLSNEPEKCC
jgi:hypothetical protein